MPIYGNAKGIIVPPAISGRYYDVQTAISCTGPTTTAFTMAVNRLHATPIFLGPGTYTKIGVSIGTAAAAGKVLHCAVYDVGADGLPGALLLDPGGNLAADAIAVVEHTISFTVKTPRTYYVVAQSDGAPVIYGYTGAVGGEHGRTTATTTARLVQIQNDPGSYGFPAAFGAAGTSPTTTPSIWMRL